MMCTTSHKEALAELLLLLWKLLSNVWIPRSYLLFSYIGLVNEAIGLVWLLVNMLVEERIGYSSTLRWRCDHRSWLSI